MPYGLHLTSLRTYLTKALGGQLPAIDDEGLLEGWIKNRYYLVDPSHSSYTVYADAAAVGNDAAAAEDAELCGEINLKLQEVWFVHSFIHGLMSRMS